MRTALIAAALLTVSVCSARGQTYGNWFVSSSIDVMTDEKEYLARTEDQNNGGGVAVSCLKGAPMVMVYHRFVGAARAEVMLRFDDAQPIPYTSWYTGAGGKMSSPLSGSDELADRIRRHSRLRVRVRDPLDYETIDYEFSLAGSSAALQQLPCTSG